MTPRTRPAASYLPDEWLEWPNFIPTMKNILKTIPKEVVSSVSWDDLLMQNSRVKTTLAEAKKMARTLPLVLEDVIIISRDGEPLAVFLKNGLYRPWKDEKRQQLH